MPTTLVFKSYQKSTSNTHWQYYQRTVMIPENWEAGKKVELKFIAYRGLSYTSEVALDDIHFRDGQCQIQLPLDATPPPRPPTPAPTAWKKWSPTVPVPADPMKSREYQPFFDKTTNTCEIRQGCLRKYPFSGTVVVKRLLYIFSFPIT